MPNTIQLSLLDNKATVAQMQGIPLANENSYRIIAGEQNATIFAIVSKPTQYASATYTVEMVNSQGYGIAESEIINNEITLPNGMAVAGYGYMLIRAYKNSAETTIVDGSVSVDYSVLDYKKYEFIYDSGWKYEDQSVILSDYGITLTGTPTDNDTITVNKEKVPFQPLKVKVWNTIPNWIDDISESVGLKIENGYLYVYDNNSWVYIGAVGTFVVDQDLSSVGFTPVANTYYKHTGTTGTYTNGIVYLFDGTKYTGIGVDDTTILQDLVSTAVTLQAQPKTEYYYGELTSITLTFANGQLGDLFYIKFDSGATPTDIVFDNVSNAVWDTDFTAEADKTVEICGKWDGSKWLILMTQL